MREIDTVRTFWRLFSEQRWDDAKALLHSNLVVKWPQSRELMRGPENFIAVNRYYPGNHTIEVLRAASIDGGVVTTVWITADTGQKTFATSYFSFIDDKIESIEEYWAEPYPSPAWRTQWVENY